MDLIYRFRRTSAPGADLASLSAPAPESGYDIRATGRFVLDEKNAQRFLDVPAGMGTLQTGEMAVVANVDASSNFMGITTEKRAGLWALLVEPGSLARPERGTLYLGLAARPAIRFQYRSAATHQSEAAILTSSTAAGRAALIAERNQLAGYGFINA